MGPSAQVGGLILARNMDTSSVKRLEIQIFSSLRPAHIIVALSYSITSTKSVMDDCFPDEFPG